MSDFGFANTIAELALGETAASVMTDCEKYGMMYGCNGDCPQLLDGNCEIEKDYDLSDTKDHRPA